MTVAALVRTERLRIRPVTLADVPLFHALVTRPEVARMLFAFHEGSTLEEIEAFLAKRAWKGTLHVRLSIEEAGVWRG